MTNISEESMDAIPSPDLRNIRRAQVMGYLRAHPGETNEAVSIALDLPIQSVTPRTRELKEQGRIWITGKRLTDNGRRAAELSPAACPICGREPVSIVPWGEGGFAYRCPCGCEYVALVGPGRNQSAVIMGVEDALERAFQ